MLKHLSLAPWSLGVILKEDKVTEKHGVCRCMALLLTMRPLHARWSLGWCADNWYGTVQKNSGGEDSSQGPTEIFEVS